jgi:2-polyprenyl-3-methyl-5-hydroxy-6-metoxy-1,4-benzoquinol methylase
MKEFYDELYRKKGAYHWENIKEGNIFYVQHAQKILCLVNKFAKCNVLDVGCGDGYLASQISQKFEVIGIDISREAVKVAKNKNPKMDFIVASCTDIPFPDNSFDTVVASEVIEHINYDDGKNFLKEARRALNRQGRIIVSTPNLSNLYMRFLQFTSKNIEHLKEYTKKEFTELVSMYFKIILLNSGVSLPIFIPKIGRLIKISKCYNYCIGEKV